MPQTIAVNEDFLRTLSSGLHGLAQPLSIISGYLELSLDDASNGPSRELTETLLEQSRRASGIAQFVSQLTRFQTPAPDVADVLVSGILEAAIEDTQRILEDAQLTLLWHRPDAEHRVSVSPSRLKQVLVHLLDAIRTVALAGEVIHLGLKSRTDRLKLQVHLERGTATSPVRRSTEFSPIHRALTLLQAVVSNTGGTFAASTDPLFIRAEFPVTT